MLYVLRILNKSRSTYSKMYKSTKVSHTTLQRTLKDLSKNTLVIRYDVGHKLVDYEITNKGRLLLKHLEGVRKLID